MPKIPNTAPHPLHSDTGAIVHISVSLFLTVERTERQPQISFLKKGFGVTRWQISWYRFTTIKYCVYLCMAKGTNQFWKISLCLLLIYLSYLFDNCFTPYSRMFHLCHCGQYTAGRKHGSASGKPMTMRRMLQIFLCSGGKESSISWT